MTLQPSRHIRRLITVAAIFLAPAVGAGAALAQSEDAAQAEAGPLSHFQMHAFFSQGWGKSDGSLIEGVPEDGTTNLRSLALQFRYDFTADDVLLVQLNHEARGDSLLDDVRDTIGVEWAFYEHRFNDTVGLRLGRVRVPLGIYNEIRDVGILLPFFEAPESVYTDGLFTQESVDGAAVFVRTEPGTGWHLSLDGYVGEWERELVLPTDDQVDTSKAKDGAGLQVWLETPAGVRFGLGGLRYAVSDSLYNLEDEDTWTLWVASVDASFARWIARAEYMQASYDLLVSSVLAYDDGGYDGYYAQLGYRLTDRWTLWAQYDVADVDLAGSRVPTIGFRLLKDYAVSVTYAPRSEVQLKAEAHSNEGYNGYVPGLSAFTDPPVETDYAIVSVSVAF